MSIDDSKNGASDGKSVPNGAAVVPRASTLVPKPSSDVAAKPSENREEVILPPFPPGIAQPSLSFSLGMIQQPNVFATLSEPVKQALISHLDKTDERSFKHAQEHIQTDERVKMKQLEDRSKARRQVLILGGILAGSVIACGAGISILLILEGKPEQAHTLMMSGFGVIGALLGGVGITGVVRKIWN